MQLYEATGLLGIAWLDSRAIARVQQGDAVDGTAFRLYLASYALLRFLLDPLRADGRPERYLDLTYPQYIALAVVLVALLWQVYARREAVSGSGG